MSIRYESRWDAIADRFMAVYEWLTVTARKAVTR